MRLIDADAFKLQVAEQMSKGIITQSTGSAMMKVIDIQPTAYDEERVVAELENASHWEEPTFDEDGYRNDDSWEVVYLDKATEIVRKGGIE